MTPSRLVIVLGRWGIPHDDAAWAAFAFGLGCILATLAGRDVLEGVKRASRARFLGGAGLLAAFLTLGYAAHFLRGGPRIIDATTYVLQAKALAHGHVSWHVPFPSASFRGRFLLFREPDHLAGIFPPGWPLLLSAGFLLGSPMLIGIALAAGLVVATYFLALEITNQNEGAARLAAMLSALCPALRYQTADPMAHAASALGITIALACAIRAARDPRRRVFITAGVAVGYVVCTRPISALPIALVVLLVVRRASWRNLAFIALGTLPGIALLLFAQHGSTGSFFTSTQRAYYAASDGPPDCFRYGFGDGIGCLHEHGDFVRARLAHGYGALAAFQTTLRRVHVHLSDALAAWPVLVIVLPACIATFRRERLVRVAWLLVGLQIVAYVPFYFDGDYPGAGARFYADVLPIEHVAIAASVVSFLPRFAGRTPALLVGLLALGFGLHGAYDALALAERDGGRPMFEPERLQDAHIEAGLLFMDTDHGFNLAHDPFVTDSKHGLVVARQHNDGHDRLLYEQLKNPPTWAYRFAPEADKETDVSVGPYTPASAEVAGRELWRFESEAEWPPLSQHGAWAEPIWATGTRQNCPYGGQALAVRGEGEVTIAVPIPRKGEWTIRPFVLALEGDGPVELRLRQGKGPVDLTWSSPAQGTNHPTCVELAAHAAEFEQGEATLEIHVSAVGPAALDRVELVPAK